jgi:hypothetical protein
LVSSNYRPRSSSSSSNHSTTLLPTLAVAMQQEDAMVEAALALQPAEAVALLDPTMPRQWHLQQQDSSAMAMKATLVAVMKMIASTAVRVTTVTTTRLLPTAAAAAVPTPMVCMSGHAV